VHQGSLLEEMDKKLSALKSEREKLKLELVILENKMRALCTVYALKRMYVWYAPSVAPTDLFPFQRIQPKKKTAKSVDAM
jgi:hypothetical protein